MNPVKPTHIETVAVENSDDRLAKVEEAKRTGQPFQSVAANKTEIVPYEVAAQIAEDKAQDNTYVDRFGRTYAGQLETWHEALADDHTIVELTNEEKAQAHSEYSDQFVRDQMKEEAEVQAMMAKGYDPSLAVQQANLERAMEHEAKSIEYTALRNERTESDVPVLAMVDEVVEILRAEDLGNAPLAERAQAMSGANSVTVPVADEKAATDALKIKDAIISTEIPYQEEAKTHDELQPQDTPSVEIMKQADSPEALREETALAQLRADNPTEEAAKAETEMEAVAADMSLVENSPGEIEDAAEEAVGGGVQSDEMLDNPEE